MGCNCSEGRTSPLTVNCASILSGDLAHRLAQACVIGLVTAIASLLSNFCLTFCFDTPRMEPLLLHGNQLSLIGWHELDLAEATYQPWEALLLKSRISA